VTVHHAPSLRHALLLRRQDLKSAYGLTGTAVDSFASKIAAAELGVATLGPNRSKRIGPNDGRG
jgi:hypothetical protein